MVAMKFVHDRKLGSYIFFLAALVFEVFGVFRTQECALVMIEPPGQARIRRVFEIDDGVLVSVKHAFAEQVVGLMGQAREREFRTGMEPPLDKSAEKSR